MNLCQKNRLEVVSFERFMPLSHSSPTTRCLGVREAYGEYKVTENIMFRLFKQAPNAVFSELHVHICTRNGKCITSAQAALLSGKLVHHILTGIIMLCLG